LSLDEIRIFHNDDDGYEDWVTRHGGYVLTVSPGKPGYMLHDSECMHLARDSTDMHLTRKPRTWARYRRDLVEWTEAEVGERPKLCRSCM
jgi:hypothetical protein